MAVRKKIAINVNALIEESITNHSRAGIKIDNKSGWDSNEPIFKGSIGNVVLIDYREYKDGEYNVNDTIGNSEMRIKSFTTKSVTIEYPNGDFKTFYLPSNEELKK